MLERQLFTFEIVYILRIYRTKCRKHKHDNQSYDTLKQRSDETISTNNNLKVRKQSFGEHHNIIIAKSDKS